MYENMFPKEQILQSSKNDFQEAEIICGINLLVLVWSRQWMLGTHVAPYTTDHHTGSWNKDPAVSRYLLWVRLQSFQICKNDFCMSILPPIWTYLINHTCDRCMKHVECYQKDFRDFFYYLPLLKCTTNVMVYSDSSLLYN